MPTATLQVVALVYTVLDYGNGVLAGLPAYPIRQLQSVLNAAARLIYRLRSRNHITDALISLHWLRVPERIQYKLTVLTYKILHGCVPSYLGSLVRVDERCVLLAPTVFLCHHSQLKLSTAGSRAFPSSRSPLPAGTACLITSFW